MKTRVYREFDAFAESVRGVDSKMLLRNPNNRVWTIDSVEIDSIDVQVGRLGSGNIAQGQLRQDGFMFYLPLTERTQYTANGNSSTIDACAVMEPGSEFCFSTMAEHDWIAVFVPTHRFKRNNDSLESFSDLIKRKLRVTTIQIVTQRIGFDQLHAKLCMLLPIVPGSNPHSRRNTQLRIWLTPLLRS